MPIITEVLEQLPKVVREIVPKIGPEVRGMLNVLGKAGVNENVAGVAAAAAKKGLKVAPDQMALWDQAAPHVAKVLRAKRLGISHGTAYDQILMEADESLNKVNTLSRESYSLGQEAKPVKISRPELPAETQTLTAQLERQRLLGKLKQARELQNHKEEARLLQDLEVVNKGIPQGKDVGAKGAAPLLRDFLVPVTSHKYLDPKVIGDLMFGTAEGHMVTDYAAALESGAGNSKSGLGWWFGLTSKKGPAGWFANLGRQWKFKREMRDAFQKVETNYVNYSKNYQQFYELSEKLKTLEQGSKEAVEAQKNISKLLPEIKKDLGIINSVRLPLFDKWARLPGSAGADARIAMFRGDPSLRIAAERMVGADGKPLLSEGEKAVANAYGEHMGEWKRALDAEGINTMGGEEEYTSHRLKEVMGKRRFLGADAEKKRALGYISPFHHRTPGSLMFYPSIHTIATGYIPMAARKLAVTAWRRKWMPILGTKEGEGLMGTIPKLQQYFQRFARLKMENIANEPLWEKAARQITAWTYLSKVGLTLSTPLKHIGKAVRLVATHPFDATRAIPKTIRTSFELAAEPFGLTPGNKAKLLKNYMFSRNFFEAFSGLSVDSGTMNKVNTVSQFLTTFVETFERGLTFWTSVGKAERKGLSHAQFQRAVWDMMLSNSFVGGADRPLWLHHGWQQLLGIFAYTKQRITAETFKMFMRSLPERYIQELKGEALQTMWRMPRDAFGTPNIKHFIYFTAAAGLAEAYARQHDTSIFEIIYGDPFWMARKTGTGYELTSPPLTIYEDFRKRGGDLEAFGSSVWDFATSFSALDRYLAEKPYMTSGGEWWRHYTAMPSVKAQGKVESIFGPKRVSSPMLEKRRMERMRDKRVIGRLWPFKTNKKGETEFTPPWRKP